MVMVCGFHQKYNVISLFSGCGGGDLGLLGGFDFLGKSYERLPFEILWANDFDSYASKVYQHNLKVTINTDDIRRVKFDSIGLGGKNIDVIIAGFPCQDFSMIGLRKGLTSKRGQLYKEVRRALRFFHPKLFLAENVPGIEIPPQTLTTVKRGLQGRKYPKYRIQVYHINTADYGVPQLRKRVLLIGVRDDIHREFQAPKFTYISDQTHWVTAENAIEDLWDPAGTINSKIPDQMKLTHASILLGHKHDRKLDSHLPSPTIRAQHHGHIHVHYNTQSDGTFRRLTVRECARLQSFPDSFTFPVSTTRGYIQIGNAIPPILIHYWGQSIANGLRKIDCIA
jgi:DNA (cytosine-5)-methyltransferase 1